MKGPEEVIVQAEANIPDPFWPALPNLSLESLGKETPRKVFPNI